ncbi:ATP-binding protein [Candidatus Nitrotoga sp. M5]|uniref:ATP-binding protein n=1 Tax=Candidatus Nitrotoga sp. M5 TaxID=2890409 RepID=UPI001EF19B02|nr:ATP-binding protein [Candidatus Nitrotoga sp. M5]CAH1385761.1 Sensor protein QseC [Candidatus Nitrotoga sp. M5]
MWRRASLKRRLLVLTLTTITLVWLGSAAFTYQNAREEFDEVLDAHLAQAAALLIVQSSHELNELETGHAPLLHKYARQVAFQVWNKDKQLRLHSANAPSHPLANEERGFSDHTFDGHRWRVFSAWNESAEYLIQVAERSDGRDDLARGIAGNMLKPLFISLPLLALLLWIAVARGLRPLDKLTCEVEQREPDNLAALDASSAPREVVPLIERLNRLFARIEASLQKERRFTADAAHELRTPVAAIKAQTQVARAACSEAERNHALDNAILGCNRAAHLIEQLLALTRIDALGNDVTETCQVRVVAAEVIAEIAPTALSQHVHLELIEGAEVEVRCNPVLLRILLRNLIDNAVRHTQPGTSVWVSITRQQGLACLSVNDNGPGIPATELTKVLERFYRPLGTSASGSGLGLPIVHRIAEVHGATLQIAPHDEGNGLSVKVIFKS